MTFLLCVQVAKYASKKAGWSYIFKSSLPLLGMKVEEFSNSCKNDLIDVIKGLVKHSQNEH